jgi:hypothetical protein
MGSANKGGDFLEGRSMTPTRRIEKPGDIKPLII